MVGNARTTTGVAGLAAVLRSLVHSNLLISISATSVAVSTMVLADLTPDPLALFIVFAATMFVYSFNRLADIAEDQQNIPDRATFVEHYGKPLLAAGGVLYLGAIAIAVWQGIPGAPAIVAPVVVAVLYSVVGLKRVLLVKNLMVGGAWGLIPLGVGVYYGQLLSRDVLVFATFITVMLTIAAAVFDIKDIEGDTEEGIRTLPVVFDAAFTRRLSAASTALVAGFVVAAIAVSFLPPIYSMLVVFNAYIFGYCLVATPDKGVLFYGFVIDSEHILLAALLVGYDALL